jgi:peptide/nickel transport system substrate-binding protein
MDERRLRSLIEDVRRGRLSRRSFTKAMIAVGLTAPMAAQMLASSGVATAAEQPVYRPTKRGGGGELKLMFWQGPMTLNAHFAPGIADADAARIFYEPLAGYGPDGSLVPILAAEIPTLENGGLSEDGLSVTWKLKKGVRWHDGVPFTADDCVFTSEYATDPAHATVSAPIFKDLKEVAVDDHTLRIEFASPRPFWYEAHCGSGGILPRHIFEPYMGSSRAREAPANFAPVGNGPYVFVDFKPGDLVKAKLNPDYHMPNRPHFDTIEVKGGGDAISAARAVLQTGDYDFAWNVQVEDGILKRFEQGGKGHVVISPSGWTEILLPNNTDPWTEIDGERSSIRTKHPSLTDPAVRDALSLLVDRDSIQQHIYGRTAVATANIINGPERFISKNTHYEFNIEKAIRLLDEGGWKPGVDGIRERNGVRLKLVFRTITNAPRNKTQAIVKQACQRAGIDLELQSVISSVAFDQTNSDGFSHFTCDLQMWTTIPRPDPQTYMRQFVSSQVSSKANKFTGANFSRWQNAEFDRLYEASECELDPVKRAALLIAMNDLVIRKIAVIPIVARHSVAAVANNLHAPLTGWGVNLTKLHDWYRDA